MRDGHHGGAGGHQQAAQPDDARTVESVPEVAEEDDQDAITDLRDKEKKGATVLQLSPRCCFYLCA